MDWVRRTSLFSLGLFFGGLGLGFGFEDGGRETGLAEALTTIGGYMYLLSLPAFGFTFLLLLTVWMPAPAPPSRRRLHRVILGLLYGVWLIVPALALLSANAGGGGIDGAPCGMPAGWAADHSGPGSTLQVEYLDWPPLSHRCIVDGPEGHFEQVFPTTGAWLVVFALVLLPPTLFRLARWLTRDEFSAARWSYG